MGLVGTLALAGTFVAVGIAATALQAWLWRFPMVEDPTGRDPHGVSTAPRGWTNLHRALGLVFAAIYLVLLAVMVPRLWRHAAAPEDLGAAHVAVGLLVGPLLAAKVLVIRRFQRFGHRLPWLGGALCAGAVAATALVAPAAARLLVVFEPDPGGRLAAGRAVVHGRCLQCHGPTRIAGEGEDLEGWREEIAEMQRRAARTPGVVAITDAEAAVAAAFLAAALPDGPDDEGRDDDRGRRGRGRR